MSSTTLGSTVAVTRVASARLSLRRSAPLGLSAGSVSSSADRRYEPISPANTERTKSSIDVIGPSDGARPMPLPIRIAIADHS